MTSTIRIKMGQLEVDFEGSEEFLKNDLMNLLNSISELHSSAAMNTSDDFVQLDTITAQNDSPKFSGRKPAPQWTVSTIASKLNVKSGKHLVVAACAYLHFMLESPSFSRTRILDVMKDATGYYQQNYSKNLSRYLTQLVKDDSIIESSKNTYALTPQMSEEVESKFGR